MNPLKRRLAAGDKLRGCFLTLPSADVADVLAQAGFDFLLIDHEHAGGSIGEAIAQMRAMAPTATSAMVRLPALDPTYIKRILDAGAQSLLCPGVETAEEAASLVQACLYPPQGVRGAGGGVRASRYGFDGEYHATANDRLLIAAQIESVTGGGEHRSHRSRTRHRPAADRSAGPVRFHGQAEPVHRSGRAVHGGEGPSVRYPARVDTSLPSCIPD